MIIYQKEKLKNILLELFLMILNLKKKSWGK